MEQVKIEGVLLGLAAGDRIGGPTQMALRVAESLADRGSFDSGDILYRYLAWWRAEGFDTGPTADEVFRKIAAGTAPSRACREVDTESDGLTAGCNPAHRSVALALAGTLSAEELAGAALEEARLTHWHPLAGDVAAATVGVCRVLINGGSWTDALTQGRKGRLTETQLAFADVSENDLSASGYAPEVLKAALHFVGQSEDLDEALRRSIHFAGPGNYCPVLVGSLGGAQWGVASISPQWYAHHGATIQRIREVSSRLSCDR